MSSGEPPALPTLRDNLPGALTAGILADQPEAMLGTRGYGTLIDRSLSQAWRRARQKTLRRQRHHSTVEDTWLTCHRQFVKELDEWDKQGGWDVLFYGDSIVEEWRCVTCPVETCHALSCTSPPVL